MLFGCPRENINHSSENLKVIYIKQSMFYAIINYQCKTSGLKNVEKLAKQTVQAFKSYQNRLGMCIFVQSMDLYSWQVVLENLMWSLKNGCSFLYEPWQTPVVNELALHESTRYQNNNCHRSFPFRDVLILCISQESHVCLHVDCESFTLALWPTLRKKFMNF